MWPSLVPVLRQLLLRASLVAALAAVVFIPGVALVHPHAARAITAEITIGRASSAAIPRPTWRDWLLYKLDLVFAFNPSFKVLSLALVCAVVTLIGGLAYSAAEDPPCPLGEAVWNSWSLLIDAGTQKQQDTAAKRRVSVALTVAGVLFLATLLGVVVEVAGGRLDSLRRGRTRVLETGHTLIIGWNSKTVPLARQLMSAYNKASPGQQRPVVVLGDESKEVMDEKIRSAFSSQERANFRIVARSGSPFSVKDLSRCSAHAASSIIVLPPETLSDANAADQHVIHAALSVSFRPEISANVVADLSNDSSVAMLQRLYTSLAAKPKPKRVLPSPDSPALPAAVTAPAVPKETATVSRRMVPVATGDAALRALVISAVNPRCAAVWNELLTFDGNEYHFRAWPELTGQRIGDAIFQFDDAILCGILRPSKAATSASTSALTPASTADQLLYCPDPDTVIQEGDQLLFIAEDRFSFKPGVSRKPAPTDAGAAAQENGERQSEKEKGKAAAKAEDVLRPKQKMLVSWWRPEAKSMLELIGSFLEPGSAVTLLDGDTISANERKVIQDIAKKFKINVDFSESRSCSDNSAELASLPLEAYDTVIVLRPSCSDSISSESATATAMMIRHLQVAKGRSDALVVAEVTFEESSEPTMQALRAASGVNFAMVPEAVQAQVLAQLSENADVGKLIDRLVSKHLGSLKPRSILRYAKPDEELSYWDLQERAMRDHNEIIVAWERGPRGSWIVNPSNKGEKLFWAPGDQLMVIKSGEVGGIL